MGAANQAARNSLRNALKASGIELRDEDEKLIANSPGASAEAVDLVAAVFSARTNESALRSHADALRAAAHGSELYARKLASATWVLAVATIVLAIATIVLAVRTP